MTIRVATEKLIAEEAPESYKDVSQVKLAHTLVQVLGLDFTAVWSKSCGGVYVQIHAYSLLLQLQTHCC